MSHVFGLRALGGVVVKNFTRAPGASGIYSRTARRAVFTKSGGVSMPQGTFVAEREWARVLARRVSNQLPEAIRQLPDLQLTAAQVEALRATFENTLVTNMGCEVTTPGT